MLQSVISEKFPSTLSQEKRETAKDFPTFKSDIHYGLATSVNIPFSGR